MEWIDTHCHLAFESLLQDLPAVLERSRAAGVTRWICIGTDLAQSQASVKLAQDTPNIKATVGLHPHDAKDSNPTLINALRNLATQPEVVAMGEMGLDYHYRFSPQEDQQEAFRAQLDLAIEADLPVVVHTREAFEDTLAILDERAVELKHVVLHCFTGNEEQARIALERGYFLSFTGIVTFKNAHEIRAAAQVVPLDRLMIETDAPYMSPEPVRKQHTNEPTHLVHTAAYLASLKQVELESFCAEVRKTSEVFFGL